MNDQTTWTIKRLLDWTSDFFQSHGTDQPRLAAEILLAEALHCQRIDLYTRFEDQPDQQQRDQFRDWVRRHAGGEPVAYLVGHREFYSLRFRVNSAVLIPRPETEQLVGETIDLASNYATPEPAIIDIGTGSGIIAITLAKYLPTARLTAVDVLPDALTVATDNAVTHEVIDRIEFLESDLFSAVAADRRFDFVVSNPPYIGEDERDSVPDDVKKFEPEIALFTPGGGTAVIEQLVEQAAPRLVPGGYLLMEISPVISQACRQLFDRRDEFCDVRIVKDLARLDRVLIARRR